jgi:hypothetical protein
MAAEGHPLIGGNFLMSGENIETSPNEDFVMNNYVEPVDFHSAVGMLSRTLLDIHVLQNGLLLGLRVIE